MLSAPQLLVSGVVHFEDISLVAEQMGAVQFWEVGSSAGQCSSYDAPLLSEPTDFLDQCMWVQVGFQEIPII